MAKRGKIERAGVETDVLAWSQQGLGSRAIAKKLLDERGLKVSHVSVARFLTDEVNDRERTRRVVTASKAAALAGNAATDADDNLDRLRGLLPSLLTMATQGVRRVQLPDDGTELHADSGKLLERIEKGLREWVEPVATKDQIRAATAAQGILAYLVELAGGNPRAIDPKKLADIRAAIAEVFGYAVEPQPGSAQEAPLSDEEHQPPVMH